MSNTEKDDLDLFKEAMSGVKPLVSDKKGPYKQWRKPHPIAHNDVENEESEIEE